MSSMKKVIDGRYEIDFERTPIVRVGDENCTNRRHAHRYVGGEMIPGCITGYHCDVCGEALSHYASKHDCEGVVKVEVQ